MEVRYTRPNPEKDNKISIAKVKKKFKKEAKKLNLDVMKIDTIIIGCETFYNPYKYKSFNRWC
jgi:hypothetical protein